jgi:hypothetical protein
MGCSGQIGRVDQSHRFACDIDTAKEWVQQMMIDAPQLDQVEAGSKFNQHFCVGQKVLVFESAKISPWSVFLQQFDEQIKRVNRSQKNQQIHSKKLCRGKKPRSPRPSPMGEQRVD